MRLLALDQGTTNTKALVLDGAGEILARASAPVATAHPRPGWAEQSACDIWTATKTVIARVAVLGPFDAIGIANQRETLVVWDAQTGAPVGPAPLWQCRRTTDACAALEAAGHGPEVAAATGLGLNPLFPATKLAWMLEHRPEARRLAAEGRLRAGTVDAWLIWNLTGGAAFATDHSNASRTLLFDTETMAWSPRLSEIFGVPPGILPEALPSDAIFGLTAEWATDLPAGVPIRAVLGDSHAALYGHGLGGASTVKATYGTGSSLMMATDARVPAPPGLSATVAWTEGGVTTHALEGNITVSGQAAAFAAEMLGLADVAALSALAQQAEGTGGVAFVPALAGLGAPYWDDAARGLVTGMSLGTTRAHLARAAFEGIAHQIADVFEAFAAVAGKMPDILRADGGGSANDWLMALQADLLGVPVERGAMAEIGALGVAAMAARALGTQLTTAQGRLDRTVPRLSPKDREAARAAWRTAVARARFRP
jgi:glycerol kinase